MYQQNRRKGQSGSGRTKKGRFYKRFEDGWRETLNARILATPDERLSTPERIVKQQLLVRQQRALVEA